MRKTLHTKFVFIFLIMVLVVFFIFNTFGCTYLRNSLIEQKKNVLYKEAGVLSESYMENYFSDLMTFNYLKTQLTTIDTALDTRIWIVNRQKELILDTRSSVTPEQPRSIDELNEDFLSQRFSENVLMGDVITEPMISVVLPVSLNYTIQGYIVMLVSYASIEESVTTYMNVVNLSTLLIAASLFILFLLFSIAITIPVRKITKGAKEYSAGHYEQQIRVKSDDEFKDLADSVNFLASRIINLEEYQSKFIANISHDFRSPLTSIKGYAEAIIDGTIPPEMQEKYLNIILFETERLTKLTTNLLELNSMKSTNANLHIVSFDINHIIKKTAESFEGIGQKKRITLNLIFEEEETLVDADLGKIQQVLYNLIDNAIKFSHQNSSIQIKTEIRGNKLFVSVKDAGIGIPQDSINKVWDRFYKTDLSRGKDKKGTGLGLSIVKEIINAHNENINVISTEGAGSEFIFSLPLSK
ncbi:HAMP domain-containing sensor histidine kinase [Anaerolentibacter hominis]|uniref:sensor histidine kinase n=1 Tax=Anaerolentibacter hominis TaxID=3079009 RepID=UPI0031B82827